MESKIEKWFESQDYASGLALLAQHSKNRVLLNTLSRKQMPAKLEYELRKIASYSGNIIPQKQEIKKQVEQHSNVKPAERDKIRVVRGEQVVKYDELPKPLQARWDQNADAYKEIRATHEKLKLMEKALDSDRKPLTMRIAALDDSIRKNWEVIDAYDPTAEPEKTETIDHNRIVSNRTYISKNLKKLDEKDFDSVRVAEIIEEIRKRAVELIEAGETITAQTLENLRNLGIDLK